jgi:hypothetical protein
MPAFAEETDDPLYADRRYLAALSPTAIGAWATLYGN